MFNLKSGLGRLSWRSLLPFALTGIACFLIFLWRLTSLTPGLSPAEVQAESQASALQSIIHNPVNLPHKLVVLAIHKLEPNHTGALRLASVIFALIFCFCFYKLAVGWFGKAIGIFSTLIFATFPLLIITARQLSPGVMFFSPVVFMWLYVWLLKSRGNTSTVWFLALLATALFIYTPGILLLLIIVSLIARQRIFTAIANVSPFVSAAGLLLIFLSVALIGWAGVKDHTVLKTIFLVPSDGVLTVLKRIGWMAASLFVRTGADNDYMLGHLPVLNILVLALLVFGAYAMQGVARTKAVALGIPVIFAILAAGLSNNIQMLAMALPSIGLFVAAGLRYLYIEWRSIFPRNPVPKTFALILIAAVTVSQLSYGLHYALVAWPHSAATRSTYVLK